MSGYHHRITVFTPTYNRAHTLERLYRSLREQTFTDFEWLIIDDGSSDNTTEMVNQWIKEDNLFPIRYYSQENRGKHIAINSGLRKARGELFFTADSDDFLTNDALKKVDDWVKSLPENKNFCGVVGNMGSSPTETPNTVYKGKWRDANLLERYPEVSDLPIDGERVFVFFTEIHNKYPYPEFQNEKFMTEAVTWNRMASDGYRVRVFNDIIYIYKYLPNGLTLSGNQLFFNNPKGYGLWMREKAYFLHYSYTKKIKMYYGYFFSQKEKISVDEIAENIGAKPLIIMLMSSYYSCKRFCQRFKSEKK